jgi:2-polyprenyl-3-methyl-5-hydroxy-6-metoxy-1,4-benzoquinol methylase
MSASQVNLPEDERRFSEWLRAHAPDVLREVGLRQGFQVLDYGCGEGAFALPAAEVVAPGTVYAADMDGDSLARLRARAAETNTRNVVTVRVSPDDRFTTLGGSPFDTVLLYDVLHLVDHRTELLRQLCGLLKPDGFVSVFPMHIGTEQMLELARRTGMLELKDRLGMILNFSSCEAGIQADANDGGGAVDGESG